MPLKVSHGIGAWIKDFQKSDAPQFKGRSDKERRDQAIAAYLSAKRDQKEGKEETPPFDGPYKKKQSVVPGKHGEGPSTAKHLAKQGMKQAEKKPVKEASSAYSAVTNPMKWAADKEKAKKQSTLTHSDRNKLGQLAQMLAKEKKPAKEGFVNESEQLDELSPDLLGRYVRKRGSLNLTKKQSKMKSRAHELMRDKTKNLPAIAGKYSNPADVSTATYLKYKKKESTNEATTFEVEVEGLPTMYIKAKSPGEVKAKLRGIVKQPSMIQGVERVTDAEMKKVFRNKSQGREEEEMDEGTIDEKLKAVPHHRMAAAELSNYSNKHGGIDKDDFFTAAKHIYWQRHDALKKHLKSMDTDPRDKVLSVMKKHGLGESVNEISGAMAQRYHDKAAKTSLPADKKTPEKALKRFAGMMKAQDRIHRDELKRIGGQK